ncbi:methyltransferase type 12 [Methylobacterium sp. Leaf104]|uniref:SAM-dependent methyltransferase n=1 Tax=Methylobacterium TaxID=407 RepID=UPI0006F58B25|nr:MULTISPECIES: SAM-dependent methyltransferase [Methylobacterium]KQP29726.1 methyltransferase type 12 [Methylobacterium sp. Leaf104]MCI9881711.1 methyltransferase domain-containing protein [Methylobacterium goesingense]
MTRSPHTLPPDYFTELYAGNPDPWDFATSPYEHAKYDATLAALGRETYAQALEVGCSIGVLSRRLADRCAALLALDVAEAALDAARARCAPCPHVSFLRAAVPAEWPSGRFDLVVLSEVLYFFTPEDLARIAAHLAAALNPGGEVVLVHWLGETNFPLSADVAVETLIGFTRGHLEPGHRSRTERYRLDVLRAPA